ncbi:MAG: CoA transferase subunit A [Isosphaeraceae bacterium]
MKTAKRLDELVAMIPDGAALMVGGFLGFGSPDRLLEGLASAGRKGLTVIANDTARPGIGVGKLIDAKAVRRLVTSHIGTNPETQPQMLAGELEVELAPQGTLAERIRTAAYGLGGVLTKTGLGTLIERDKLTSSPRPAPS